MSPPPRQKPETGQISERGDLPGESRGHGLRAPKRSSWDIVEDIREIGYARAILFCSFRLINVDAGCAK